MDRYVLFPIRHQKIWTSYKGAVSTFWTAEEVPLSKDIKDWTDMLNDNERYFIKNILAFFAGSDGIVMENLANRFMKDVDVPEAKAFYAYQIFIEGVHSEVYSLLIDTFIKDPIEKDDTFKGIIKSPSINKKAMWAKKWIDDEESTFAMRLIGFALVEGVFFSGSFCAIYWLKSRGLMPGLTTSNEWISRDEGMHTDFAVLLYNELVEEKDKPKYDTIVEIFKEAVAIEKEFITESIPCNLIGMNNALMSEYIEFIADRLITQLGYEKIWGTKNPFPFAEYSSLRGKANFFEKKETEYARPTQHHQQANVVEDDYKEVDDF